MGNCTIRHALELEQDHRVANVRTFLEEFTLDERREEIARQEHEKTRILLILMPVYFLWVVFWLIVFWLRPLALLRINCMLKPLDFKLPAWLGSMTIQLRFLLFVGFLNKGGANESKIVHNLNYLFFSFLQRSKFNADNSDK